MALLVFTAAYHTGNVCHAEALSGVGSHNQRLNFKCRTIEEAGVNLNARCVLSVFMTNEYSVAYDLKIFRQEFHTLVVVNLSFVSVMEK
jgi:hypothetical protein